LTVVRLEVAGLNLPCIMKYFGIAPTGCQGGN
jgi:hypothetical protein